MDIGNIHLNDGIIFAPMAGVSDRAYRRICREFGAEYCVTEMVSAKAVHFDDEKTAMLARIEESDSPCAVQIFGSVPEIMAESASKLAKNGYKHCMGKTRACAIDINMGCPVKKITSNGEGSALMKNPDLVGKIVRAVVSAVSIPVTVKIRAGWDDNSVNAVRVASVCEENGAAAVTVHGRTKAQLYSPPVNYGIIRDVKKNLSIPVIGNGGIMTAEDAINMYEKTGCDGIMVARGAQGNPFIFAQIRELLHGNRIFEITTDMRIDTAEQNIRNMLEDQPDSRVAPVARKIVSWYIKGMRGAAEARVATNKITKIDDMFDLLEKIRRDNI